MLLASTPARAEDGATRGRGWLTGLGLGLTALSLTGFGLGIGGALNAADANSLLDAYVGDGRAPLPEEATTVLNLQSRAKSAQTLSIFGFVMGGVALAGAVTCLVLDGIWASRPVDVAFVPTASGGVFTLGARF